MRVADMADCLAIVGFDPWSMTLGQCVAAVEAIQARDRAALLASFRAKTEQKPSDSDPILAPAQT